MGIMPYTTEKTPVFQVVESYTLADRDRALALLWRLLDGDAVTSLEPILSTTLDHAPYETPDKRKEHAQRDWWGWRQQAGTWTPQAPFHPVQNPYTGFWNHWYGDAEGIFRETMIRALSLSLGLPREDPATTERYRGKGRPASERSHPQRPGQHWPLTILWKCPQPWYEGWIEFQQWGAGPREGHVTVALSTPGHGVELFDTPVRPPAAVAGDPYGAYELNPRDRRGTNGLWVVSHVHNRKWRPPPSAPSPPGAWGPPVLGAPVESHGAIVCVSPAVGDGGVAPSGIPYQAP